MAQIAVGNRSSQIDDIGQMDHKDLGIRSNRKGIRLLGVPLDGPQSIDGIIRGWDAQQKLATVSLFSKNVG